MTKKALCVGINTYSPNYGNVQSGNLKGCVNDANAWGTLLKNHFNFPESDINLVLEQEATKANIVSGLKALLAGAKPGDALVYTFSGHGTYLASKSERQLDYDQAQCPFDYKENFLVDKELRELFYNLPREVSVTVISDSCYSGSVTRKGKEEIENENERFYLNRSGSAQSDPLAPLDGIQLARHLPPSRFGGMELDEMEFSLFSEGGLQSYTLFEPENPESEMNDVLLSGCSKLELSRDVRFPAGHFGVLTFYALHAIKRANYQITFKDLHKQVRKWLVKYKFSQTPQLEGKAENKNRPVFT